MASPIIDIQKKTILVVGGSGVGKTSFINKVSNKPFDRIYNPTIGTNKSAPIIFNQYELVFLEISGEEYPDYLYLDGAIVMFDIHSEISYNQIPYFIRKIRNKYGAIPTAICGNKLDFDETQRKIKKNDQIYLEISSKSSSNYDKILEKLFR